MSGSVINGWGSNTRTSAAALMCPILSGDLPTSVVVVEVSYCWSVQLPHSFSFGKPEPLSLSYLKRHMETPKLTVKLSLIASQNIFRDSIMSHSFIYENEAICAADILGICTALRNFVIPSVTTSTNWMAFIAFGSGLRMSIIISFNWPLVRNSWMGRQCFSNGLFQMPLGQIPTVL